MQRASSSSVFVSFMALIEAARISGGQQLGRLQDVEDDERLERIQLQVPPPPLKYSLQASRCATPREHSLKHISLSALKQNKKTRYQVSKAARLISTMVRLVCMYSVHGEVCKHV